jgi:D-alanyl-D-alanine-carboxypeptidase/D-alanyl-D-alanine-endopeptidase
MQGHDFDGSPLPTVPMPISIECAGGLHSTANDMARWMKWHVDRFATADHDLRLLDHAAYLYRDGLTAVAGLDDAEPMDAMGLGWVINMPVANRPLILQKSGGLQGTFAYLAIAPTRGVAAFFVMTQFNTSAFKAAVTATNGLTANLRHASEPHLRIGIVHFSSTLVASGLESFSGPDSVLELCPVRDLLNASKVRRFRQDFCHRPHA